MPPSPAGGETKRSWKASLANRFAALGYRNFRLFWTGHAVSTIGTWMQHVALMWLVYQLTTSPFLLGLLGVCLFLPILLFSMLGGVVADRVDRRRLVQTTQTLHLVQAVVLASYVTFGEPAVVPVLALAFVQGCINAFDFPGRQSFLSELVDPPELPNAIALNSMAFNVARLVGPAIGGVLIASVGGEVCFWANALTYTFVVSQIRRIRLREREPTPATPALSHLRAGMAYVWSTPRIRNLLILLGLVGVLGFQYVILLPVFAGEVLGTGARGYGLLMAAAGVGSLSAFVRLTAPMDRPAMRRNLLIGLSIFGAGLVGFSYSTVFALSMGLSIVVGMGMILYSATTNMMIQIAVKDEFRGRVMSLFTLCLVGTSPVGSFVMGTIAERFGAPTATRIAGIGCILGAIWVVHRLRVLARREAAALPLEPDRVSWEPATVTSPVPPPAVPEPKREAEEPVSPR